MNSAYCGITESTDLISIAPFWLQTGVSTGEPVVTGSKTTLGNRSWSTAAGLSSCRQLSQPPPLPPPSPPHMPELSLPGRRPDFLFSLKRVALDRANLSFLNFRRSHYIQSLPWGLPVWFLSHSQFTVHYLLGDPRGNQNSRIHSFSY